MLAFRGVGGEPPRRYRSCGVSPVPLFPQESRTFRSNQLNIVVCFIKIHNNNNLFRQELFSLVASFSFS